MANDGQGAPRVLVTGASRGLGRDLVVEFARRGCRIAIADLNAAGVEVIWPSLDAPAYIMAERLNASGGLDRD